MNLPLLAVIAAGALAAQSIPAAAQTERAPSEPEPGPAFSAMEPQELFATFRSTENRWLREPCDFGVPLTSAMLAAIPDQDSILRIARYAEILCADEQEEYVRGAELLELFEERFPEADTLGIGLYFDRRTENAGRALARLRDLDDAEMESLSADSFWQANRLIGAAGRSIELEDLTLEWAASKRFVSLDQELHEAVAIRGLAAAARAGNAEIAKELLTYIFSPGSYISLLVERKYEPLWPAIEERAGRNLDEVGSRNVARATARLENDKFDRDRFSAAARALHYNGQFLEAISLAEQWREREERGAAIEEGDGWALNIQAYAYDSLGEVEKADRVFDELAALNADENSWIVNFVINRASRLVGQGRWEEGLEAARLARDVAEQYGSTFAKLIIARDHACALKQLGRSAEAQSELDFLRENYRDGAALTIQGLMCHGLDREAAELLEAMLRATDTRDSALDAFYVEELDLFYTQSILPNARSLLADHPDLASELSKYIRALPEEFIPRASLARTKLDLPVWNE